MKTEDNVISLNEQDKKRPHLDDILKEKFEKAYHKQTSTVSLHDISKIASEHCPIDLAYAVVHLPYHARFVLYDNLPDIESKISFIINTDNSTRVKIFRYIKNIQLKELFEKMATDEAVWISEDLSERKFRKMMELIDFKKSFRIKEQRRHARNTAGRIMSNDFFAFTMDVTIKEASGYIRDNPNIDFSKGVFVVNEDMELQGYVPSRNIIINSNDVALKQIMKPISHKVTPEATREEIVDIAERYKVSSIPVIEEGKLIGLITHEDMIETMEDLADETIAKMTGTSEKVSTADPLLKRFLSRSPWLVVTLIAGLVNMGIMSSFQKSIGSSLIFVLFFVPLITGMSGNVGIQCSTVLVRGIAIGTKVRDSVFKELITGLFTGVIFGICCGAVVYSIDVLFNGMTINTLATGVIVSAGLVGACFAGTFLGVFSPIFFARLGVDPAISSGPIVTAFNDFFSMTIYFFIAWGLGSLFF